MSKLIGRRVKLVKRAKDISCNHNLCLDYHAIGQVLRITNSCDPATNPWPLQCCDNYSRCDLYRPEQLRYLNNKPVVL